MNYLELLLNVDNFYVTSQVIQYLPCRMKGKETPLVQ